MIARWTFALVGAFMLVVQCAWWLPQRVRSSEPSDAQVYYRAVQHLATGEAVYGDVVRARRDVPPGAFIYPPTALALLVPFHHTSAYGFQAGFFVLSVIAFWMFAAGLAHIVFPEAAGVEAAMAVTTTGAFMQLTGVGAALALGNADILVWALVVWAFASPRAAGVLLTVGAAVKIYPLFVLLAWWPMMDRRFRVQVAATASIVILLTLATVPLQHIRDFFTVGLPMLSSGCFAWGNVSVVALALRPFVMDMAAPLPHWMHTAFSFVPILAVGAVLYTQRGRSRHTLGAMVLIAAVWTASICWWWRLAFALLISVALVIRKRKEQTSCVTV